LGGGPKRKKKGSDGGVEPIKGKSFTKKTGGKGVSWGWGGI